MSKLTKRANFALQGGGAHGAFTWGVLDKIFESGQIEINAMSGASAGAMNAVVCADGLMRNGPEGAREALEAFWKNVSEAGANSPIKRLPLDIFMGNWNLENSPGYHLMDGLIRMFSPYQLNPLNINPLKEVLEQSVDFDLVRSCDKMNIFISATNVETGKVKVFDRQELTADMVMASACLPLVYQAVEIEGIPYWDGGYMGNPSLFPFHSQTDCADIVVIQINPIERKGAPVTAHDILNRINEISFNGSLLKELRSIEFVSRLIREGKLSNEKYCDLRLHIVENQDALMPLGGSSKMNVEWEFLCHLRDLGRETASDWLDKNLKDVGLRSTVDLREMFQPANS